MKATLQDPRPLTEGGATNVDEQAAAKLLETYVVARPDDLAVERVWQRVAGRPEPRRLVPPRVVGFLVPGLALCLILALGFVVLRTPARTAQRAASAASAGPVAVAVPAAELAAARGGVFFSRPAERWQPGEEGQPLAEGQSLRTDASGRAVLDVFGIASILISRGTDVALERLNGGTFLRLAHGSVVARVSKRPPSEPFVILTDRFSIKVVGTLFGVDQDVNDRTLVTVREGVVEVTSADGRSWRVRAGQSWSSNSPESLGSSAIADSVKTLLEDGLRRANPIDLDRELGDVEASARSESQAPIPAAAPAPVTVPVPVEPTVLPSRLMAQLGGPRRRVASPAARFDDAAGSAGSPSDPGSNDAIPLPPPPVLLAMREPIPTPPVSGSPSPSEPIPAPAPIAASPQATSPAPAAAPVAGTYLHGLALERAGKLKAAADEFVQAAASDPEHADLALYALGRLRQHRLHDPFGALEAFETYRSAYPSGALLPEVDLAVFEVEVAGGHRDQALAESVRFLASHPASERLDEVRLVRGDLLRDRGDCRAALDEYREVRRVAFAEEALYETAHCQRKLGDVEGARQSLRQYRHRYPAGTHREDVAKALGE